MGDTVWDFATSHGYSVSSVGPGNHNINVYYVGDVVTCHNPNRCRHPIMRVTASPLFLRSEQT